jgi:ligand-binding sensor domain-containing protein
MLDAFLKPKELTAHLLFRTVLVLLPLLSNSCTEQEKKIDLPDNNTGKMEVVVPPKTMRADGMACDKAGNIWLASANSKGVYRFNGRSFTQFTTEDGLSNNKVWCVFEDDKGILWFGTGDGVTSFDGKQFNAFPINKIAGQLLGTEYKETKFDSFGMPYPMDNSVLSIMQDEKGVYWLGTVNGIYFYDGKTFSPFYLNDSLRMKANFMNNEFMMPDREGNIWIGGRGSEGVSYFNGKSINHLTSEGNDWLVPLLQDNSGKVWFGSVDDRIYQYDGKNISSFQQLSGWVYSMAQDNRGNLWFNTGKGGGVTRYDGKSLVNFTKKDGLIDDLIYFIVEDGIGNVWFGAKNGLTRFDGKAFVNFSE